MNQRHVQMLDYFKISLLQNAIHNHIRLFEPLVIKALKQYTTTTSVQLQRQVLDLLAQLVQLRVNYCLLDSDQVGTSPLGETCGTGISPIGFIFITKILAAIQSLYYRWKQILTGGRDSSYAFFPSRELHISDFSIACKLLSKLSNNYLRAVQQIELLRIRWCGQYNLLSKLNLQIEIPSFCIENMCVTSLRRLYLTIYRL